MTHHTTPARLLAVAVLALLAALAVAAAPAAAKPVTLEMKGKTDKKLKFAGPKTVQAGEELAIENLTDPMKVGPHSFTLLQRKLVPKTNGDARKCFGKRGVCTAIFGAHELDMQTGEAGVIDIDVGQPGWDVPFGKKKAGDSWWTAAEGEATKRTVTAKPGTRLDFFCAIHPLMKGKIKVK
jgi:hypothetical protein